MGTSTKIVLIVEYEGTRYYGFQLQANVPTIQGEIETALWKLTGERMRVIPASRTDTGVHALGQVVSFRTHSSLPLATFVKGLNYYLPRDIAVKAAYNVDDNIDIRRSAISREYSYHILNSLTRSPLWRRFAYMVSEPLDIEVMNESCRALIGKHDFASFTTCEDTELKDTVKEVYRAEVEKKDSLVTFRMVADSFLRHQIRNTVGSLIRVGLGRMTVGEFRDIIEARTPGLAGPRAPACGLCLKRISYPSPFGDGWGDIV